MIILAIVGGKAGVLIPAVREATPRGAAIPTQPPDEANRIRSPETGLSMVVPEGWKHDIRPYGFSIDPPASGRVASRLLVTPYEESGNPDTAGYRGLMLRGGGAFEKTIVERKSTFDDPARTQPTVFMNVRNRWVKAEFLLQGTYSELPAGILPYLETIQVDP